MLKTEEWMDLKVLAAQGHSIRAIAEMTGLSRNTVRRALRQRGPEQFEALRLECGKQSFSRSALGHIHHRPESKPPPSSVIWARPGLFRLTIAV